MSKPPKFELPPPEHRPPSVESWKTPMVAQPHTFGPPPMLTALLLIEVGLALFQLYRWEPEELILPGCPPIQALFAMLVSYFAYKGKNTARILAFIGAGFWVLAGVIVLSSRTDLLDSFAPVVRALVLGRATFEVFFALYLTRPDAARYFEQRSK